MRYGRFSLRKALRLPFRVHFDLSWRLGDEVSTIPVYQAARRRYPDGRITVSVNFKELLCGSPFVDEVNPHLPVCDRLYDLRRTDPRVNRYGYLESILGFPVEDRVPKIAAVSCGAFDPYDSWRADNAGRIVIAVCAESSWACKNWPLPNYDALCRRIADAYPVAFVHVGVAERCAAEGLDLVGKTDVSQLLYVLKRSAMFIGNDTAALHAALALGRSAVGLFGPVLPSTIIEPRRNFYPVGESELACLGCWSRGIMTVPGRCPMREAYCMSRLSVETVYQAAVLALEGCRYETLDPRSVS